jgi:hypothetical protein
MSPALPFLLAATTTVYLLLLLVIAVTAALHPDSGRRADARRVLEDLLSILTRLRRR